ncbi:MAG: glycosyltransferase family 4 protein, partial [Planctomycetota bacterium]
PIPVIVSERSYSLSGVNTATWVRFNTFRWASKIVTNSFAQAQFITTNYPYLTHKLETVWNSVDLNQFRPSKRTHVANSHLRIAVAASINPAKNTLAFMRAFRKAISQNPPIQLAVDWYGNNFFANGRPTPSSSYYLQALDLRRQLGLESIFRFQEPVKNLQDHLHLYDAACLPSIYEGCPNWICEGMAAGLPILASNVSDLPLIVTPEIGWLFAPNSEDDMTRALIDFAQSTHQTRLQMASAARGRAEQLFSLAAFAERYERLIYEAIGLCRDQRPTKQ